MRLSKIWAIGAGLLIALSALPRQQAWAAANAEGKTLTFRLLDEPETLDWNRAHTPVETYLLMNLMEGLVSFDEHLKIVPALAESWTVSPDGRVYTFHLRKNVLWTDGQELKAKDFVYSWKRLLSPVTAASYAYFLFDIENAELFNRGKLKDFSEVGVKALDDFTLQVKLARPIAYWLSIPTFWVTFPLREDMVDRYGTSWEAPGKMITLGPYMLSSRDMDSRIVLKANPSYYGKRGNLDTVIGLIVRDHSTALNLYVTGKLDFMNDIATLDLKKLRGKADLRNYPYLKTVYIGFVTSKYPTSNVKIRRALAMAIDRSKFGEILYGGQQTAHSFVPPQLAGHSDQLGLRFDPSYARSELRSSGIDPGKPLKIELIVQSWEKQLIISQYIQNELSKNLGIKVEIEPFDNKTFRSNLDLLAYPTFLTSWSADYPDPDNFLSLFLSQSGNNRVNWKNEKYDELIMNARGMLNPVTRNQLYLQAQKLLQEDAAAVLPLYYEPNLALVKPWVKGLDLNPLNYLLFKRVNIAN